MKKPDINNMSEQEQIKHAQSNPFEIKFISNPSEEIHLAAIKKDINAIFYIKNPSKNLLLDFKYKPIKYILQSIKIHKISNVVDMCIWLDKQNLNWPELDIIKTSLRADGKLL